MDVSRDREDTLNIIISIFEYLDHYLNDSVHFWIKLHSMEMNRLSLQFHPLQFLSIPEWFR